MISTKACRRFGLQLQVARHEQRAEQQDRRREEQVEDGLRDREVDRADLRDLDPRLEEELLGGVGLRLVGGQRLRRARRAPARAAPAAAVEAADHAGSWRGSRLESAQASPRASSVDRVEAREQDRGRDGDVGAPDVLGHEQRDDRRPRRASGTRCRRRDRGRRRQVEHEAVDARLDQPLHRPHDRAQHPRPARPAGQREERVRQRSARARPAWRMASSQCAREGAGRSGAAGRSSATALTGSPSTEPPHPHKIEAEHDSERRSRERERQRQRPAASRPAHPPRRSRGW